MYDRESASSCAATHARASRRARSPAGPTRRGARRKAHAIGGLAPEPRLLQRIARCGLLFGFVTFMPFAVANDAAGDSERGRKIFLDRELGHCILCHETKQIDVPFQGNLGPDLSDVAARLTTDEIRAKVEDPTVSNPESAMRPFGAPGVCAKWLAPTQTNPS